MDLEKFNSINELRSSIEVRKKFVEEFEIPIDVFEDPYFSQRLITLNQLYNCRKLWDMFIQEVSSFESFDDYIRFYEFEAAAWKNYFKDAESYITNDLIQNSIKNDMIYLPDDENVLTWQDHGKMFIRFSFKDNGYAMMHKMLPEKFTCETWADMLDDGHHPEHLKYSKEFMKRAFFGFRFRGIQLRYIIFGMIRERMNRLTASRFRYQTMDELVFQITGIVERSDINRILDDIPNQFGETVDVDIIQVQAIGHKAEYGFLAESMLSGNVEIIGCDNKFINQIMLYMKRDLFSADDLIFNADGHLAKFLNPIENPFTYINRPAIFNIPGLY